MLEKLKAVLLQADELGLSKTHAEQLARIRSLCGDIFGEKPVSVEDVDKSSGRAKVASPSRFETDLARAKAGKSLHACHRP